MYIYSTHISHYKGISDLWFFPNSDLNVLIGPNNSGKTSILNALKFVLDPSINFRRDDIISQFDFYEGDTSKPITIETWLKLNEHEPEEVKTRFSHKLSSWNKKANKLEPFIIDPLSLPDSDHLELLALQLRIEWIMDENIARCELSVLDETHSERHKISADDKELIGFKYFPSKRDPLYQFSMGRYSLLSKLISDKAIASGLRKIQIELEKLKSDLVGSTDLKLFLENMGTLTSPEILGGFDNFTLTFLDSNLGRLRSATSLALEKKKLKEGEISSEKKDKPLLPLSSLGDGVQNMLLLLQISKMKSSSETQQTIIALEEPEQNLEPSLAKWAFVEICRNFTEQTVQKGQEKECKTKRGQIFITTHSPSLIAELKGAESLCRIGRPDNNKATLRHVIVGSELDAPVRKSLEQHRDRYSSALLAQHALIVEGASEEGLLPILFNALANEPGKNPFHLGLSIVNGENNITSAKHSRFLKCYGVIAHILLDCDGSSRDDIIDAAKKNADFVTSWPKNPPLAFANGYDIEIMLVANVKPEILFEAIKKCYGDTGHSIDDNKWSNAKDKNIKTNLKSDLPDNFPDLDSWELNSLASDELRRAFLLAALHGPHDCKNTKDMRTIAEYLAEKEEIPPIVERLRHRIVECMVNSQITKNFCYLE